VTGSWGSLLKPASYRGDLCFGPSSGQNVGFTSPADWLGPRPEVDVEAARHGIVRRFLAVNGPATVEAYVRWWGAIRPGPAKKLIESLGDEVSLVDLEGQPAYLLAGDVAAVTKAVPVRGVRLLPGFDQYVIAASRHAERFMPGDYRDRVWRPQGWLSPVVLVNGRMDGVWRHERKGARLLVQVEPFLELAAAARRGVEAEAERLAAFLGGTLDLSWKT
jgi:hypothetical protein